jgi:NAD(P)H dehydrogenase (quinone)
MAALLVIAHPSPASFSHAMAEAAREALQAQHHPLHWHDLYAERFNPVQPVGEAGNTHSDDLQEVRWLVEQAARPITSQP